MARGKNEVLVEFAGDADKLEREARRSARAVDDFGDKVDRTARQVDRDFRHMSGGFDKLKGFALAGGAAIGAGLAVGVGAAIAGISTSIGAFLESETAQFRQQFQFDQAGLGGFVSDFRAFNEELARVTPFDDDAFASAQAILARAFGTPEEIKRYTRLAADLAAVTGRDLPSTAGALVKAAAGSTRILKDFGIDLGAMADEGENAADIFALLEEKVGGAAVEFGQTAPGQLEILKNRLGEVAESVGAVFTPAVLGASETFLGFVEDTIAGAQDVGQEFADLGLDTGDLESSMGGLKDEIDSGITEAFRDLKEWVRDNKEEFQDLIDDVAYIIHTLTPLLGAAIKAQVLMFQGLAGAVAFAADRARDLIALLEIIGILEPGAIGTGKASSGANNTRRGAGLQPLHAGTGGVLPGSPGEEVPFIGLAGERVLSQHQSGMTLTIRSGGSRMDDLITQIVARSVRDAGGNVQVAVGF